MERDELIITVYCWVCDQVDVITAQLQEQGRHLRGGGFAPGLSDAEALTIELCGEMFRLRSDKSLYSYFHSHWRHFFPRLPHRTSFVRQVANLWKVKQFLQQRLLHQMRDWYAAVQPLDTMPVPVCKRVRANRDRCFLYLARVGHCGSQQQSYYGFKLGLRITPCGLITHFTLLHANTHDSKHLEACAEELHGVGLVDKGFFNPKTWRLLAALGAHIVGRGPKKVDKHRPPELRLPDKEERAGFTLRKLIETVGAHLCQRFGVDSIRVHDLWHFEHRLLRKILAHNLAVMLNLLRGHQPLDLDHLIGD